jgi:hypothetical protein
MSKKNNEVIKFFYFSEVGGEHAKKCTTQDHQNYCNSMIEDGYTLINITHLGGLDDRRDSYEGTLIYQWRLKRKLFKKDLEILNKIAENSS